MAPHLNTIPETAEALGVSENHVYRLIASGDLDSCDISQPGARKAKTRVSDTAIERFIKDRTRKAKRLRTA